MAKIEELEGEGMRQTIANGADSKGKESAVVNDSGYESEEEIPLRPKKKIKTANFATVEGVKNLISFDDPNN